ncbi:MAG: hypothetical protein KTR25_07270 [Myxococcales bacterium]|nr:hypothetical protein [Myxococcales bacterium]
MKRPDHEKSLLGRVPPGMLALCRQSVSRKAGLDSHTQGQINRLLTLTSIATYAASGHVRKCEDRAGTWAGAACAVDLEVIVRCINIERGRQFPSKARI